MDAYELISPKTGKPCGVWVCGRCNKVMEKGLAERCCLPCACGKESRNRFEARCTECADADWSERRAKDLEKAELVEWDGESMIFSEEVTGYRDGWFYSPEDLRDYLADEDEEYAVPEFAFVGKKQVRELDIDRAVSEMTEDTYEDAELHVADSDWKALMDAVDTFNAKYRVTYYVHDYSKKVRVSKEVSSVPTAEEE